MVEFDTLGGDVADSYTKWFILGDLVVYAILFFASLGIVASSSVYHIYFYILFGFILATVPSIIEFLNRDKQELPVDTVTIEEADSQIVSPLANWRVQLGIGIFISILIGYSIWNSQSVFVAYPVFALSPPFLTGSSALIFNALISAISAGWVESRVFWSTGMPTVYNLINKHYDSTILAAIGSIVLIIAFFTGYHLFVYANSAVSLQSVAIFALINCLLVLSLRSVVSNTLIHGTNNFVGLVLQISKSIFGIAL